MTTGPTVLSSAPIKHYLDLLYSDAPPDAWVVVSWLSSAGEWCSSWTRYQDRDETLTTIKTYASSAQVYIGLGLRDPTCQPSSQSRGTSAHVLALPGLWIEMDHSGGIHASPHLPSPVALQRFIDELPFTFSLLIDSGGGLHGYALFRELWILETDNERQVAAHLLKRFQRTLQLRAAAQGWHIDSTTDLARVLRPAGTLNHKTTPPRPVAILAENDIRYNPSDLADAPWMDTLDEDASSQRNREGLAHPAYPLAPMVEKCAWLRHCQADAATLPEPEWYAMLNLVGRCLDGESHAHTWSRPYPGYSAKETQHKLTRALEDSRARTCQSIRYDLNADAYCRDCPSWGTIKSPIILSMPARTDDPFGTTLPPLGITPPLGWDVAGVNGANIVAGATLIPGWRNYLLVTKKKNGEVTQNITNFQLYLQNHEYWQQPDHLLWWDSVRGRPMIGEREIDETALIDIGDWFGRAERLGITMTGLLQKCVLAQCHKTPRDLLRLWLTNLPPWDGVSRLRTWLTDIVTVDAPRDYTEDVSRVLPLSMVARVMKPGCHYRYVVIFEGAEEIGKTALVRALATQEWYVELSMNLESKESHMMLQGVWVAELSELDSLSRTEETRLKVFITAHEDSYIPKFSNFREKTPRRSIFIGTTNDECYLKGQSGNTRYLPLRLRNGVDIPSFQAIREQLFAEAMIEYALHPDDWWQLSAEGSAQAREERESRRVGNPYEQPLYVWLEYERDVEPIFKNNAKVIFVSGETTWPEIAEWFLKLDSPEKWKDKSLQMQIAAALKAIGWRVHQVWKQGRNTNVWRKEPDAVLSNASDPDVPF